MYIAWTKHIKDPEEKTKFENSILGSRSVLERQAAILKEMEADLDRSEMNTKIYDLPNWDYRQAHMIGFRDCLSKVSRLINLDHKEIN